MLTGFWHGLRLVLPQSFLGFVSFLAIPRLRMSYDGGFIFNSMCKMDNTNISTISSLGTQSFAKRNSAPQMRRIGDIIPRKRRTAA